MTLEFKNEKYKNKQKSYTQNYYMGTYEQFETLALLLFDQAWPMDPCRQISIKLINLRDAKGRTSESTVFIHGQIKKISPVTEPVAA